MNEEANQAFLVTAQKHRYHLEQFRKKLAPMMPLTSERIEVFTETDIAFCDAFIMRFCMLQDIIGGKLFDVMILLMDKDPLHMTIIDKTNFLEKIEIIPTGKIWHELRKTINKLTHEYPNAPILSADAINKAFEQVGVMCQILDFIADRLVKNA